MIKNIVCGGAALLAATATFTANAGNTPTAESRLRVVEQPIAAVLEYDVLNKTRPGSRFPYAELRENYVQLWEEAMSVCDEKGGYVTEYHEGEKRSNLDTREAAVRIKAYAACHINAANEPAPVEGEMPPTPYIRANGLDSKGSISAIGSKRLAYGAIRSKVYQICLDHDRRVRYMSIGFNRRYDGTVGVEAAFACNAGMEASYLDD